MVTILLLSLGGVVLVLLLYIFSVKTIIAVFLYQELDKGYEVTEHPEHDAWAKERGIAQAKEAATERALLLPYCYPFLWCMVLFHGGDE